jgi:hypothetical protein
MRITVKNNKHNWVVPEKIHTPPTEEISAWVVTGQIHALLDTFKTIITS